MAMESPSVRNPERSGSTFGGVPWAKAARASSLAKSKRLERSDSPGGRVAMGKEKNTGGEKKGQKKAARSLKEKRAAKRGKKKA
jgi:hypothetical protein